MPVAIVSVTNDLTTDQRVDRSCMALVSAGFEVLLVGRLRHDSRTLANRPYRMHRLRLLFDKGALFYAEYNIALFFFLLSHKYDLILSNDLDSLPANYLANLIKKVWFRKRTSGKPTHIHDCHEYFRGVPELVGRKTVTRVWKWAEDFIFPKLKYVVAVNQSVADLYSAEYGNKITVVRNMPFRKIGVSPYDKALLDIGPTRKVILYQGAVNVDRGLEEAIAAMKHINTDAVLVIAGTGDVYEDLRNLVQSEGLTDRVRFTSQVPFQELHKYTRMADLGLSIEKDVSINYHYCLPNKFLDYIQAGVPVLVSPFPEMKAIVERYCIGDFLESHDPKALAAQMDSLLNDPLKTAIYHKNLQVAAQELCWEMEERMLLEVVEQAGCKNVNPVE